jgi:outer membrane protein OmpA-like peptidoglycan-associated protein
MKIVKRHGRTWFAVVLASLGGALAGCDPSGDADAAPGPSTQDCEEIEGITAEPDALVTALVVDNTASGVGGPLPQAIETALAAAQQERIELVIVAVDGATQRSAPVRRVALDPRPGEDSPAADNARAIALQCVAGWAREAVPVAEGSAILEALAAASREHPSQILVVSDGLANSGAIDLNTVGFDVEPAELAAALRTADALDPQLAEMTIVWAGIAESSVPLPQAARNSLLALWQELLGAAGAEVTFDSRTAPATGPAPDGLPADPVEIPEVSSVALPCGTEVVVPAALLFAPDSADLVDEADALLQDPARQLADNPNWTAEVSGHTANYGTPAGRQRLSTERARVVEAALIRLGARDAQVNARGYGATRPREPETPDNPGGAAANRRVEIAIHIPGCGE